jgi:hypothetical protein
MTAFIFPAGFLPFPACSECGGVLPPHLGRGPGPLTCSPACKYRRDERLRERHDRTCVVCGCAFASTDPERRACSPLCGNRLSQASRSAAAAARAARTCVECGKPFQARSPSGRARRGEVRANLFCSRSCAMRARNRRPEEAP